MKKIIFLWGLRNQGGIKMFKPKVLIIVILSVLFLSTTHVLGQTGSAKIDRFVYSKNHRIVDTTSTTTVQVPQMKVTFRITRTRDVLVRFCVAGNMFGTGTGATHVTAEVDGAKIGSEIQILTSHDSAVVPRCFEWIAEDIKPGDHTVIIKWRLTKAAGAALTGRFHESILTVFFMR